MNKTCDNCKWLAKHCDMCCHAQSNWKGLPESNTCDNWGAHPLVQLGIDIERTRCAKICADIAKEATGVATARECERLIRGEG